MLAVSPMPTPSNKRSCSEVNSSPSGSPFKRSTGSPSVRRLAELGLQNDRYNRELLSRLEQDEFSRGKSHQEALVAAAREHERVRRRAQLEQKRNALEIELSKQVQEEAERQALDQERERQVELEIEETRRKVDEARRLAELRKKADDEKLLQEEETRRAEQERKDQERLREEQYRLQEERRQARAREQVVKEALGHDTTKTVASEGTSAQANGYIQAQPGPTPPTIADHAGAKQDSTLVSSQSANDEEHHKYLNLHARMKEMRKTVLDQSKNDPDLKKMLGEWRRDIRSRVGQATGDTGGTAVPKRKIITTLNAAMRFLEPTVDARQYTFSPLPSNIDAAASRISGPLLYVLNIFTKRVVSEWVQVAGADTKAANPAAILAISIFATNEYKWQGVSFFDMLLAKLHKVCPVLFGIYGNDKTESGRTRLGWAKKPEGGWESEQRHSENMTGLGAGFAAIALRKFPAKSALINPYPPINYWKAFARILNTPASQITNSHLIVLKAMIEHQAERFLEFFGRAATVALRTAVYTFPANAPTGPAKTAMSTLPAVLLRDYSIKIA